MRSLIRLSSSLVFLIAFSTTLPALAIVFTPGTGGSINGAIPPIGTVLGTQSNNFTLTDAGAVTLATGTVNTQVVREDASGLLRFEYQMSVDAGSPGPVDFLIAFNFGPFNTDIDFVTGSAGDVAPTDAVRSINTFAVSYFFPGSGGVGGGLQPSETSLWMFVRTDATAFDTNGIARTQQGLDTFDINGVFQPVPIPAAAWLFGSALIGLAGVGRKRKQAA